LSKSDFKLALAQINSSFELIEENFQKHKTCIMEAAAQGAQIIVFPELSLTAYSRTFSNTSIFSLDDPRLSLIEKISRDNNIIIVYGLPVREATKIYIGSLVQFPSGMRKVYYKNNLHEGEDVLFTCGNAPLTIDLLGERLAFSICFDIEVEKHVEAAAQADASIYLSSIFYSVNGMRDLEKKVGYYTNKYGISIGISNFVGSVWGTASAGKSMFVSSNGQGIGMCNDCDESILYCTKENGSWVSQIHVLR